MTPDPRGICTAQPKAPDRHCPLGKRITGKEIGQSVPRGVGWGRVCVGRGKGSQVPAVGWGPSIQGNESKHTPTPCPQPQTWQLSSHWMPRSMPTGGGQPQGRRPRRPQTVHTQGPRREPGQGVLKTTEVVFLARTYVECNRTLNGTFA